MFYAFHRCTCKEQRKYLEEKIEEAYRKKKDFIEVRYQGTIEQLNKHISALESMMLSFQKEIKVLRERTEEIWRKNKNLNNDIKRSEEQIHHYLERMEYYHKKLRSMTAKYYKVFEEKRHSVF